MGEAIVGTTLGAPFVHPALDRDGFLSREQLLTQPGGRRALWRWERGDDAAWEAAYDEDRHASNASEVQELAAAGNPWARELIEAGYPEPEVTAVPARRSSVPRLAAPQVVG